MPILFESYLIVVTYFGSKIVVFCINYLGVAFSKFDRSWFMRMVELKGIGGCVDI